MRASRWAFSLVFCVASVGIAQQNGTHPEPTLSHRLPLAAGPPEGQIKLDVVVTDDAGHPVAGLERKDFTLLDNKKPQPILSFQAVNGAGKAEPPVEVILLVDFANTSLKRVAFTRYQVANYLRQNGGHLPQPTSMLLFFDQGVER